MNTKAIKKMLWKMRIPYWAIAEKAGCHENTIQRWLRGVEIPEERAKVIFEAVSKIKEERNDE